MASLRTRLLAGLTGLSTLALLGAPVAVHASPMAPAVSPASGLVQEFDDADFSCKIASTSAREISTQGLDSAGMTGKIQVGGATISLTKELSADDITRWKLGDHSFTAEELTDATATFTDDDGASHSCTLAAPTTSEPTIRPEPSPGESEASSPAESDGPTTSPQPSPTAKPSPKPSPKPTTKPKPTTAPTVTQPPATSRPDQGHNTPGRAPGNTASQDEATPNSGNQPPQATNRDERGSEPSDHSRQQPSPLAGHTPMIHQDANVQALEESRFRLGERRLGSSGNFVPQQVTPGAQVTSAPTFPAVEPDDLASRASQDPHTIGVGDAHTPPVASSGLSTLQWVALIGGGLVIVLAAAILILLRTNTQRRH